EKIRRKNEEIGKEEIIEVEREQKSGKQQDARNKGKESENGKAEVANTKGERYERRGENEAENKVGEQTQQAVIEQERK
ncbi:10730_t:CDS:2, partial [Diversispora eburnea]